MLMKDLQFANSYKMEWGCTDSYINTTLIVESPTLISNLVGNIKAKTKLTIINIPICSNCSFLLVRAMAVWSPMHTQIILKCHTVKPILQKMYNIYTTGKSTLNKLLNSNPPNLPYSKLKN